MELFEYQAKSFLSRFALPYPAYFLISSEEEIESLFNKYGLTKGTVQLEWFDEQGEKGIESLVYDSLESFQKAAATLLQKRSSESECIFSEVMVKPFVDIDQEIALSITCSTSTGKIEISVEKMYLGEMRISKETVLRNRKLYSFQKNELFVGLHLPEHFREPFFAIVDGLLALYYTYDVVSLSIRPLMVVYNGGLEIGKIEIEVDDNSLFRQPEVRYFVAKGQLPSLLYDSHSPSFTYQEFPGSIGLIATGQALLQATVDLLYVYRGNPGLAINIGEEIDESNLTKALASLLLDKKLQVIFLNLFIGFKNSVSLMTSMLQFLKEKSCPIPVVVRLSALSVTGVQDLVSHSYSPIQYTESLEQAVRWSVANQGGHGAHSS